MKPRLFRFENQKPHRWLRQGKQSVRFRTTQRPRGLLKPGDQKRLSLLIVGFGVILVCFSVARRPEFWKRLFPETTPVESVQQTETSDNIVAAPEPARPTINHDEFFAGAVDAQDAVSVTTKRIAYDETEAVAEKMDSNSIPRVPAELLRTVKDDVIGVHSTESEAYFAAIKMASRFAEKKNVKKAADGAYALFMDSPNGSRGMAWNISGKLRKLSIVKGRSNAFGISLVYDAWLTTADSGDQLVHAVAMKADGRLTTLIKDTTPDRSVEFGIKDAPDVQFTGYFFKREGYASNKGISLAPLFLVGTLHDVPPVVASSNRADELTPYLGWLAVFICGGVLFMVWSFAMSDVAHSQTRTHQLTKLPAVASFDEVTSVSVSDALGELEMSVRNPSRTDRLN